MEYRTLPHSGEQISVLGLGAGGLTGTTEEMTAVIETAIENGINYFDMATSERAPFFAYAKAFEGRREQVLTQMHFGAVYQSGSYNDYCYAKTIESSIVSAVKRQVWQGL